MKLPKVVLAIVGTWLLYSWVNNSSSYHVALGDLLPFARGGHSPDYNYGSLVMLGLALWGLWRLYAR